ncbi:5-formyltetrahydrofolate cyclo-ligase [Corynebacterium auris]|uniref:5-formyltetrahydrofolate cyclo-ligase n=1 Tax=Corynebacterium auris TaxID=44750 RepID=UPI0025B3D3C3|nr:5-formyltetrahydrofolate cyclo-ligase [Corynebacterium auris]WJY67628.1 5-formyltetrahydrofolate cyclo-ligase family protein [Corynebacterium auris]
MSTKQDVRQERIAYRRSLRASPSTKAELDAALARNAAAFVRERGMTGNVAAYFPLPSEPGGDALLPALAEACRTVFLPISLPDGVLAWAVYDGAAATEGALGITEPTGARFTSRVLRSCDVVLAPALAVDTQGMRLGKGAGYYDRALAGLSVPVAALVYDEDVLDHVPHDAHDVPVAAALTPSRVMQFPGT